MASHEPRAGFRPPWALNVDADNSTDATPVGGDAGPAEDASTEAGLAAVDAETALVAEPIVADAEPFAADAEPIARQTAPAASSGSSTPTKFQLDLARAMRAAAETARQESVERLAAESQVRIEAIRASSVDAATELRQRADDDIAEIREWSKSELARIRAETDAKITDRKSWLQTEIEAHEESIDVLVQAVTSRVSTFEAELEAFFGRLAEEDDPTRIAALAQSLPEAPSLDDDAVVEPRVAATAAHPAVPTATSETLDLTPTDDIVAVESATVEAEIAADAEPHGEAASPDVAAAAATDAPALIDPWADAPGWGTPVATISDEASETEATEATDAEATDADASEPFAAVERRLAAFGLDAASIEATPDAATPDAATAEIDAEIDAASDVVAGETEAVAEGDAAVVAGFAQESANASATESDSARSTAEAATGSSATPTETNVIVDGLISVASIAGFKRNLSRVDGVHSVTVSSGPDGEFVFAVRHDESAVLADVVPAMPGFGARVTASESGQITVSAHDPENASDEVLDPAGRRS